MPFGTQTLPSSPSRLEKISILLVSSHSEDLSTLRNILHHCDWKITHCGTAAEAIRSMEIEPHSIVVTDRELPDGTWHELLASAERQTNPPKVLVLSRSADEKLWAEVLNLGAYDLLLKPLDRAEVTRVVGMAWRQWFGVERRAASTAASASRASAALNVQFA